jgi:hypothetical protein
MGSGRSYQAGKAGTVQSLIEQPLRDVACEHAPPRE